jgi:hypothetical protein
LNRPDQFRIRTLRGSDLPDPEMGLTETMIEAGIDAYYAADLDPGSPFSLRETIARIYRAMRAESLATTADRAADAA